MSYEGCKSPLMHSKKSTKDRRMFKFSVEGKIHNVGKFMGLENATKKAEEYSKQINKPVKLIEIFREGGF